MECDWYTFPDDQIAEYLNREGLISPKGKAFNVSMIKWVRYRYRLPKPRLIRLGEQTVDQLVKKFGVSRHVVYYWIEHGVVKARRRNGGSPYWITLDEEKERKLRDWVRNSSRIQPDS